ncbi:MAG: hypothetical protein EOO82_03505, partial [Oxalobacteraceae bacterium]
MSANEHAAKLSETIRYEFIQTLAEKLTSEYFSKSFDYLKKQQKLDAVETAQRQVAFREAQVKAMRNVSLNDFRGRILVNLDSLVKERNPAKRFVMDTYCAKAFELCLSYFHTASVSAMDRNKGNKTNQGRNLRQNADCKTECRNKLKSQNQFNRSVSRFSRLLYLSADPAACPLRGSCDVNTLRNTLHYDFVCTPHMHAFAHTMTESNETIESFKAFNKSPAFS